MKTSESRGLTEDVAARGLEDWIHVAQIVAVARRTGLNDPEALRAITIGLIADAVCRGLLVPGDIDAKGFHPWATGPGESVSRIVLNWELGDLSPTPGSVAWFDLTTAGEQLGHGRLDRETKPQ